jgi:fused signal recognition particle receptor
MKSFFKKIADSSKKLAEGSRKIAEGFRKTREVVAEGIQQVLQTHKEIDESLYEDLEAVLLRGDVGPTTTTALLQKLRQKVKEERIEDPAALRAAMREIVEGILHRGDAALSRLDSAESGEGDPTVLLIVGVNGVGKTTSLAKLAFRVQQAGRVPLIVASDTFRAAASEQLEVWAKRLDVQIVRSRTGADPGAVAFDGIQAARARGATVVLVDTAGRLQTKGNLMEELKKIHRVCGKALPGAPHETILVLDATIGQNAISQAKLFSEAVPIDSILLAKLDGTSKGGVILAIANELQIPVRYAGVGEKAGDLIDFDPALFADELVGESAEVAGASAEDSAEQS